ncbi:hypothetical protein [Amycolatopsis sp.]|uniref:hypothetical protein n=1 Tax=Amycolatopsis sp. TaxID=37632 RepID=UPI002C5BBDBA|nr:hypothetical protein [Amycolatopsis sp.]HVV11606.1 hypothetical protein [Amycolatopsis sp.]
MSSATTVAGMLRVLRQPPWVGTVEVEGMGVLPSWVFDFSLRAVGGALSFMWLVGLNLRERAAIEAF